MPTPVGHIIAGSIVYNVQRQKDKMFLLLVLFYALLPDIDFFFGLVIGDANRYHHQFTHGFVFVIFAGLVGGFFYAQWRGKNFLLSSAFFIGAGITHVVLDVLAIDKREPLGCPLWWPLSNQFVISPVLLFSDVSRASESNMFFQSLFNAHNARTILLELLILAPAALFVSYVTRIKLLHKEQ